MKTGHKGLCIQEITFNQQYQSTEGKNTEGNRIAVKIALSSTQYNNNNNDRLTAFDPGQPG